MKTTSFDPAKEIKLRFRINAWQSKTFSFLEDGLNTVDITLWQWEFYIKKFPGDRLKVFSLTNSNGLTFLPYVTNELFVTITAAQSSIEEGEYYWELRRRDIDRPWLNGWADFTYGPEDAST